MTVGPGTFPWGATVRARATPRPGPRVRSLGAARSLDEVHLVDHAPCLPAADAEEDAPVQPVQSRSCGFDLGRGTEGVLAGVDVLTAREACEHLGAAVAYTSRLDVEQLAGIGLQGVADVAERGAVREHDLPVGAGAREQL